MKKKVMIIGIILSIIWMGVIFWFSSRTSSELDIRNRFIVKVILELFFKNFDSLSIDSQNQILSDISFYVSKSAHYLEYGMLALLLSMAFILVKKRRFRYLLIMLVVILYAASDEIHQMFTSTRTPRVLDVMIDSLGGLTMILLIELFITIIGLVRKHD